MAAGRLAEMGLAIPRRTRHWPRIHARFLRGPLRGCPLRRAPHRILIQSGVSRGRLAKKLQNCSRTARFPSQATLIGFSIAIVLYLFQDCADKRAALSASRVVEAAARCAFNDRSASSRFGGVCQTETLKLANYPGLLLP